MNIDWSIFRNINFLFYLSSIWVSSLGGAIFTIVLTWMLVESTGSSAVVGTYLFLLGMSKLIFILFSGVIVDRFKAKNLLIASDWIRGGIMFLFVLIRLQGSPPLWVFYIMGIVFGMVDALSEPAAITCRIQIVEKKYYSQSLSVLTIATQISAVIGPAIGAWFVKFTGGVSAIALNGVAFIIPGLLLMGTRFREVQEKDKEPKEKLWSSFVEGIRYFITTPIIFTMAVFALFANAAVSTINVSIPFLAKNLGFGVLGFGWMTTAIGIGGFIGALLFSVIMITNPRPVMTLYTCFFQGVILLLVSFVDHFWLVIFLFMLIGFQETAVNVIAPSVNHSIIPRKMFGRVLSVMILVMTGSQPISQALAGWAMKWTGPQSIFLYAGLLEMISAVIVFLFPFVRRFQVNKKESTEMETV
ncbi:MFS transporter [Thermoactinomyces daqus]|uniref:MFS transporter n=1 Tax=Thermoactinomyces daqus TaxID=1329516 RepID=A0A7W1XAJ6_9BACL|nr:MFS transporter [Thermoactinomyces daqus]MBA4543065.1 MFS transporter [Thermoactinomyces daqus]